MSFKYTPPLQCRVRVGGLCYEDGTEIEENHLLTWKGGIQVRYNPDLDDEWTMYSESGKKAFVQAGDFEILGRKDGIYSLSDLAEKRPDINPFD
jgi:hypothetical protein